MSAWKPPALDDGRGRARMALSSLWTACARAQPEQVRQALAAGSSPNSRGGSEGRPMMHWVCGADDERRRGVFGTAQSRMPAKSSPERLECARILIAAGADLGLRDGRGASALHWAAKWGMEDICRELAAAGADVEAGDAKGATPLMWACATALAADPREELRASVPTLLALGASPSAADRSGKTPLHRGAGHPLVVRALAAAGADLDAKDRLGRSALHVACELNAHSGAAWLLELGADPLLRDAKGRIPMDLGNGAAAYRLRSQVEAAQIAQGLDPAAPAAKRPGL